MSTCKHCQAATGPGQTLCIRHVTLLEKMLGNVRGHYGDLETLRTKRTRYGDAGKGSIGKTMPLGIDLRFAAVRTHVCEPTCSTPCPREGAVIEGQATAAEHAVRNLVVTWARVVLDAHTPLTGPVCASCLHRSCAVVRRARHPQDNVPSVLAYLFGWVRWIATQEWAGALLLELVDAEHTLAALVDRPADRWFAGPCTSNEDGRECGADLYAKADDVEVTCKACGYIYGVASRRAWLLARAEDQLATAVEVCRALGEFRGVLVTESSIRGYVARGRLERKGLSGDGKHLYRVGDVLDLVIDTTKARAR